jgi:hypothetical protein
MAGFRLNSTQTVIEEVALVVIEVARIAFPLVEAPGELHHVVGAAALLMVCTGLQFQREAPGGGEPSFGIAAAAGSVCAHAPPYTRRSRLHRRSESSCHDDVVVEWAGKPERGGPSCARMHKAEPYATGAKNQRVADGFPERPCHPRSRRERCPFGCAQRGAAGPWLRYFHLEPDARLKFQRTV